jgi:hypothetical protein
MARSNLNFTLLGCLLFGSASCALAQGKPNVVYILVDN